MEFSLNEVERRVSRLPKKSGIFKGIFVMKQIVKGWLMLSVGALMISAAAGLAWSVPAALTVAGAWVIVYGIAVLNGG